MLRILVNLRRQCLALAQFFADESKTEKIALKAIGETRE
jgi:hypothetical protein